MMNNQTASTRTATLDATRWPNTRRIDVEAVARELGVLEADDDLDEELWPSTAAVLRDLGLRR